MKHPNINLIDPEKLKQIFGVQWTHYISPEGFVDINSYIFLLEDLYLMFDTYSSEVVLRQYKKDKQVFEIRFDSITKVGYVPRMKAVVFESFYNGLISQIRIHSNGTFDLIVSASKDKRSSWIEIYKEESFLE